MRRSKFFIKQLNPYRPEVYNLFLQDNQLEDDSTYFQLTSAEQIDYYSLKTDKPVVISSMSNFPTEEDPLALYKFMSFTIERTFDVN